LYFFSFFSMQLSLRRFVHQSSGMKNGLKCAISFYSNMLVKMLGFF